MKKEERQKLVQEACLLWLWKPHQVVKYIKKKTGKSITWDTAKADLLELRANDQATFDDAAKYGAMHIISEMIRKLGSETSDLENIISQIKSEQPPEDINEILQDIESKNQKAADYLKNTIKSNKVKSIAGTKAWLYSKLNEQRQFYIDVLEGYPLLGSLTRELANERIGETS